MTDDEDNTSRTRIDLWLDPEDVDTVSDVKSYNGGSSTSSAIRACIRIARDVLAKRKQRHSINGE